MSLFKYSACLMHQCKRIAAPDYFCNLLLTRYAHFEKQNINHKFMRLLADALRWWKQGDFGRWDREFNLKVLLSLYCKTVRLWNISAMLWSNPHSFASSLRFLHGSKKRHLNLQTVCVNTGHQKDSSVFVGPWMFKTAGWQLLRMTSHFTDKIPLFLSTL